MHVIAAQFFNAYDRWWWLDMVMHFCGGLAIAWFFQGAIRSAEANDLISPVQPIIGQILIFTLTATAAVFWEYAEFVSDRFFHTRAQLGVQDTLGDMLLGTGGGLAMLIALRPFRRRPPQSAV